MLHELAEWLAKDPGLRVFNVFSYITLRAVLAAMTALAISFMVGPAMIRKLSAYKATWPGRKQVWRKYAADGRMARDILSTTDDVQEGQPLLQPMMRAGRRIAPSPTLAQIRARAAYDLSLLPEPLKQLRPSIYPIVVGDGLIRLTEAVDLRLARQAAHE